MRAHLHNAWYGLLDYAAYPVAMLCVAPTLLRHLGVSGYGIFAFGVAAVNIGAIVASGFGDANTQLIAKSRAAENITLIRVFVRCTLGIHLVLGTALMILGMVLSPWIAKKVTVAEPGSMQVCAEIFLIASIMVLFRSVETVAVSTQRAFESYADAITVSAVVRILTLVCAAVLASRGFSLQVIFITMAALSGAGTALQLWRVGQRVSFCSLVPSLQHQQIRALVAYGRFTWILALGAVIFSQVDRLLIGLSMGTAAVTAYSLAAQLAQPITGSAASALHFLFPHLAHRATHSGVGSVTRPTSRAFVCNAGLVLVEAIPLLLFGHLILRTWMGEQNAKLSEHILPLLVIASAFSALSVTGNYALLALGRARASSLITLASGCLMLTLALPLTSRWGTQGMAVARLISGMASLLVYLPVWRQLRAKHLPTPALALGQPAEQGALR